jgi:hypothetical protein
MKRSLVLVKVKYNGLPCGDLYYLPGETAGSIQDNVLSRHPLSSFRIVNDNGESLNNNDRLEHNVVYEMICIYGMCISLKVIADNYVN